ncbi:gliding motility-associated C-terminal domain-containing protein [Pontibacter anaerobius]|uniref:Gliding motility-associated C-terminal domain-containing protein n=1 Tax=Pontibacter anaerobius TaxID=2993940 RepID=A0ABT3RIF0_9BACT|nr:gliding motility-associated C-terminal domain-containing protein [Pontibacter anaerobius]MCX2741271.1 gliding motility-associated C-terminal domain-containing protein [Pontibacter anaerobius]
MMAALSSVLAPSIFAQNFEWVKSAGGTKETATFPGKIYIDKNGNTYVTGTFHRKITFDKVDLVTSTVTSYGDIFIVKYAPDGKMLWVMQDGGTGTEYAQNIVVDANGDVYISGFFSKLFPSYSCEIGGVTLEVENNAHEYFVAKYDANGKFKWVRQTHNSGHTINPASQMVLDHQGNIIIQGTFKGEISIGGKSLKNDGKAFSLFTAKIDADGNALWATSQLSHIDYVQSSDQIMGDMLMATGLAADSGGNIYYTGIFKGKFDFPEGPVRSQDGDIFFVKLNENGQMIWRKFFGNGFNNFVSDLELDSNENPYLLLNTSQPKIGNVSNSKRWGAFVAKFDQNGNAYQINSLIENAHCTAMAIDGENKVYTIGHYNPQARIDCFLLNSTSSNNDAFLLSQDASGSLQWVKEIKGMFGIMTLDIQLDAAAENAYGLGYFRGDISFENTKVLNIGGANAGESGLFTDDMFIAKVNNIGVYAPPPSMSLSCEIPQEAEVGSNITLKANVGRSATSVTYRWDLGNGEVKTTTAPALYYAYSTPGTYPIIVSATDELGCTLTCSTTLIVSAPSPEPVIPDEVFVPEGIIIPNIFTPNGDGKNDVFVVKNYLEDKPFQLQIYNRWGKQVAFIPDGRSGWDGSGCSEGLYFYSISISGQEKKGWIELVR